MTSDQLALWQRIEAFDIDGGPDVELPFAARLARENGWSRSFADRALREYKRYVFLTMTAGRHMCPSEQVDQVWHLHLTYTRSYWQRFCGEVLKCPLHHEPTRGGDAEGRKHWAMYADTWLAYEEEFDEKPPADLWPVAEQRFGDDLEVARVNRHRYWLVRKPRPIRAVRPVLAGATVAAALFAIGCAGNPFNEQGTDFLPYLFLAWIMAFILGIIVRKMYKGPALNPDESQPHLDPYEIAYLTGGRPRVLATTLVRLKEMDCADIDSKGHVIIHAPPIHGDPVEHVVFGPLASQAGKAIDLRPLGEAVKTIEPIRFAKLEENGYIASSSTRSLNRGVPLLLCLGALGLVGLPRLVMGLENNRPSGYLIAAMIVMFIVSMATFVRGVRRTRKADEALANLSKRQAGLRRLRGDLEPGDASLAVALFGATVLTGTAYACVYDRIYKYDAAGTGGGCSTSSGTGCGAGDGGGGGCGGGGCGGCGGGGD